MSLVCEPSEYEDAAEEALKERDSAQAVVMGLLAVAAAIEEQSYWLEEIWKAIPRG